MPHVEATPTSVLTVIFVVSSMLTMGTGLTLRQIAKPVSNMRLVARALLANFVLVPVLIYVLTDLFGIGGTERIGFILLATSAGAAFLPKLTQVARGNIEFSVGLMVAMMVVTIIYLPIVLPLLLAGVAVDPGSIAAPLVALILVPLAAGLLIRARYTGAAKRLNAAANLVSNISIVLLVIVLVATNISDVLGLVGSPAIVVAILLLAGSFVLGYSLGGPRQSMRKVMALGTAQRNVAAAFTVAVTNFSDRPEVIVILVTVELLGLVLLLGAAGLLGAVKAGATEIDTGADTQPQVVADTMR